ncbi:hypothetical protein [Hyphomonas johnsonii]|jgi:hypothetical protein|uniref:Uncharacterized protein n=1 Tax=Hyphomonas johnsonii MHS-2 TaxID=1280950 RepID=A0A059FSW9_9PROT|nr:hypothetical protein [Hyphomonas johnsonii]KCZ93795.1 hypothetical protein HJO_00425 [Hyphomonas johnsonii MHS-2]
MFSRICLILAGACLAGAADATPLDPPGAETYSLEIPYSVPVARDNDLAANELKLVALILTAFASHMREPD